MLRGFSGRYQLSTRTVSWPIRFPRYRQDKFDPRRRWHVIKANSMAGTAASAELRSTSICKSGWRALAASWLGWMFDGYETYAIVLVMGQAVGELLPPEKHATLSLYMGGLLAATLLGWATGGVSAGVLTDYIGRKRMLMISILWYAAFAGLTAPGTAIVAEFDFPVFGVEPVTDLYPQLVAEHVYLRKEWGNGSTKRPRRPQRAQRSHPLCRDRAPFPLACGFRTAIANRGGILLLEESPWEDTSVTRARRWRRRYSRWRSRWS